MSIRFLEPGQTEHIRQVINSDPEFKLAARFLTRNMLLKVGDAGCLIRVSDGVVTGIMLNPGVLNQWDFFIGAPDESWEKFLRPVPPLFYTDLYGGFSRQKFEIGGNIEALFAHYWAVTRILDILRQLQNPGRVPEECPQPRPARGVEPVTGRYIYIEIDGTEYRVYFEQNGDGIPLLCQHTAASDGRQWRYLLNDKDVTDRFLVLVPDLPYHGRSLPPESVRWWEQEYRLTKRFFLDFQVQFSRALGLKRPVFLGCSFGGNLAVDLALERPDEFRAVIGMEAGLNMARQTPMLDWYDHPRMSNNTRAQEMYGKTAPGSPEPFRREIAWEYSQSAPSVFKGDLYYHFVEHDLSGGQARHIDTSRTGVYLLSGEYDWGNSTEDTHRLAQQIKGARYVEMKGLGHFPMTENYALFKKYLMPVLDEIAKA